MNKTEGTYSRTLRADASALLSDMHTMISESSPGRMLPSEWGLARRYNLSHNTVSKVFRILVQEGLVERQVGRGTLVKGQSVITFLLPCPNFLSSPSSNACILRQRMQGAMEAARERNLGFETIAVSATNNPEQIDYSALARINAGSMVILDEWFRNIYALLSKRRARVAFLGKNFIPYGFAQYTKSWHLLFQKCDEEIKAAMHYLMNKGCQKIAFIGRWIHTPRNPLMTAYSKYTKEHGMEALHYQIPISKSALLTTMKALRTFYKNKQFDGVLLGNNYFSDFHDMHEQLGIPETVRICGIDQNTPQIPCQRKYAYFAAPNTQMGYDAVAMLADNPGAQCQLRQYDYIFHPEDEILTDI